MIVRPAFVVVCLLQAVSVASADDRKMFGLEATIGQYSAIGAGVRIGDEHIGVHVIAGWLPLLVATQEDGNLGIPQIDYHFHSTWQGNADVYFLLSEPTPRSAIGLTAGYKGSTHLGHGAGLGFYSEIDSHDSISYFLMAGVTYFPSGDKRLVAKEDYPADTDFVFPGPGLTTGVNIGIVVAP